MKKIALIALSVVGAGAHALVLDGFTGGSYNSGYISSGGANGWQATATVVGGVRATYLGILANNEEEDARLRVRGVVSGGTYSVSAGPGVSVLAQVGYGFAVGSVSLGSNDLNLDLTATNDIRLNFLSNDLALDTTVALYSNGALIGAQNKIVGGNANPFSETFAFGGSGLSDVDQIVVSFFNSPSGDWALSSVEAVPEPASMAILGLGMAALARRRNRK